MSTNTRVHGQLTVAPTDTRPGFPALAPAIERPDQARLRRRQFHGLDRLLTRLTVYVGILCFPLSVACLILRVLDAPAAAALFTIGVLLVSGGSRDRSGL